MKKAKILAINAIVAAALISGTALAEVTGNVGVTSNYMWRGATQSAGDSSVSGGIDYSHGSGLYAGIWTANTSFNSPETDFYVGFGGEAGAIGYDLSVVNYKYLQTDNIDWVEFIASVSFGDASVGLGFTNDVFGSDTDALYLEAAYDFEISKETSLSIHVGSYDFDNEVAAAFDNYLDYSVTLSKGDWSFMFSDTDLDANLFTDGDPVFVVSWGMEVDL